MELLCKPLFSRLSASARLIFWVVFLVLASFAFAWLAGVKDWPAWIQAIGSVAALVVAVTLPAIQKREQRAEQERKILKDQTEAETEKSRKLWLQFEQAKLLINIHRKRVLGMKNPFFFPWAMESHKSMVQSLITRVEISDQDDTNPARIVFRHSLVVDLNDVKGLIGHGLNISDAEQEVRLDLIVNSMNEVLSEIETKLLGYKPDPELGQHSSVYSHHVPRS